MHLLLLAATALLPSKAPGSFPEPTVPYSARCTITVDAHTLKGTLYHSGSRERLDYTVENKRFRLFIHKEAGIAWLLLPEAQLRLKIPLGVPAQNPNLLSSGQVQKQGVIGVKSINGVQSTGFKITFIHSSGALYQGSMWVSNENILTQILLARSPQSPSAPSAPARFTLALSNLTLGPHSPQVFEIPSSFNTLDLGELLQLPLPSPLPPRG